MPNVSKIEVDEIGGATGTTLTLTTGHVITGSTGQFQISGGTAGQALTTDGTGNLTFADAGSSVTIADAPPSSPSAGDLWWESDTGILKVYYNDGTTSQWVDATPQDAPAAPATATATAVSDQANTSTGYFDLPAGTTAQRPGTPADGMLRLNTDTDSAEIYNDGSWVGFAGSTPTISGISPTTAPAENTAVTVNGTNFRTGAVVKLIGGDATQYNANSTTVISSAEISFNTPNLSVANEPYDVKVVNTNGGSATLIDVLDAGGVPTWTTAAGSLGTIQDNATGTHFTLAATDPDGQAVTFAETTSVLSVAGLILNSTTGVISGDATDQTGASTTYNFDVDATDVTTINTTARSFGITIAKYLDGSTSSRANSPGGLKALGITTNGYYWIDDGTNTPYKVYCGLGGNDALSQAWPDSAGWVRFWWYGKAFSGGSALTTWPGGSPATLGNTLPGVDTEAIVDNYGFYRIPPTITPTKLLVYGYSNQQNSPGCYQMWNFSSGNGTSDAALAAFQDGTQYSAAADTWNAVEGNAIGSDTSSGIYNCCGGNGCDYFFYTTNSGQLSFSLDDDSGHGCTAFVAGHDGSGLGTDFCDSDTSPTSSEAWPMELYFKW